MIDMVQHKNLRIASNENLRDYALAPTMRWLIATALDGATITYGQIKKRLETDVGFSTVFPTRIGLVAGLLMERLLEIEQSAPLVNVIVVSQKDHLPSKGAGSFMAKRFNEKRLQSNAYKAKHPIDWQKYFNRAASEVYNYSEQEWLELYARAFKQEFTSEILTKERLKWRSGKEEDYGAGSGKYGASGESKYHRALRLWVAENPNKIVGSSANIRSDTELYIDSGDRIDVVYFSADKVYIIEVKSRISNEADVYRGIYQCIKYRAVKKAMDVRTDVAIDAILITENSVSGELKTLMKRHDIRHIKLTRNRE